MSKLNKLQRERAHPNRNKTRTRRKNNSAHASKKSTFSVSTVAIIAVLGVCCCFLIFAGDFVSDTKDLTRDTEDFTKEEKTEIADISNSKIPEKTESLKKIPKQITKEIKENRTQSQVVSQKSWTNNSTDNMFGERDYSLWGEYAQTPIEDIKPQKWRNEDDIIDGWDWSLPTNIQPSEKGLLCVKRASNPSRSLASKLPKIDLPINPVVSLWLKWRDIESKEGTYNFNIIKDRLKEAEKAGYGVILRIHFSATTFAPNWIKGYKIPIRKEHKKSKMVNYEISHPEFHKRYLKLVGALGKSGIPKMDILKGAFVGYASPSNGDEGIGPHGEDPDKFPHVIERLDAWAKAFKGIEHKVFMGGQSNYGFKLGFGVRRGFVEMYLYTLPDKIVGQTLDKDGYLWLDDSALVIANNSFHGEENEEYESSWATAKRDFRFGKTTDSFAYRYFTANLRLLQMRCTYVLNNPFALLPEQYVWVGQSLGRTIEDSPDIWCALRESYLSANYYKKIYGGKAPKEIREEGVPAKNFERWLYQRDNKGAETSPTVKITHPIKMWMVQKNREYDYIARSGKKIGFAVDDRWLDSKPRDVAIKITYFDCGVSELKLNFQTQDGSKSKAIPLTNSGKLKTATVFVEGFIAKAKNMDYDITVEGEKDNAVVSFMRVIKL
ncbi:MAG: hypothetical protein HQL32_04235 [Planctomycetes bacterium]|nr:hypothetical protein [Planctomycetota bacterium]